MFEGGEDRRGRRVGFEERRASSFGLRASSFEREETKDRGYIHF